MWLPTSALASKKATETAERVLSTIRANGTWGDIDYHSGSDRVAWPAFKQLQRANAMAVAFASPLSSIYRNGTVLGATEAALRAWFKMNLMNDNWWRSCQPPP